MSIHHSTNIYWVPAIRQGIGHSALKTINLVPASMELTFYSYESCEEVIAFILVRAVGSNLD